MGAVQAQLDQSERVFHADALATRQLEPSHAAQKSHHTASIPDNHRSHNGKIIQRDCARHHIQ
jgi:hypothetical protein